MKIIHKEVVHLNKVYITKWQDMAVREKERSRERERGRGGGGGERGGVLMCS